MTQNYKSADSKSSKKLSGQEITKRLNSLSPLHFLSKFLYLCSFIFIFIACDTAVSSPSLNLSSWTQLRANSHFSARDGHSSVVLKNSAGIDEIYVIGGYSAIDTYLDNVWKSADGITWTQIETTGTKFSKRRDHSSVVIGSDIYVIGGVGNPNQLNDVWKSVNGGLTWTEVGTTTTFPARSSHSSVVIESDIYIIGGYDGTNSRLNDVWKLANGGLAWTKVETTTTFPARSSHSSVIIDSDIYVIGGSNGTNRLNDVWKSANGGLAWTKVETTIKFPTRYNHSSVVIGSDIYVIGGSGDFTTKDDVWKSSDKGLTWTQVTTTDTKFPARYGHSSVVIGSDIYVIGGARGLVPNRLNDVWKSTNGAEWIRLKPGTTLFSARNNHSSVVIGSDIYVIGGYDGGTNRLNDVWKSADGITWTQVATTTKFSAREGHSSVVIGSDIYVIGGYSTTSVYLDDVWKSLDDVWKSVDEGLTWTQVATTKFSARRNHSSVVIGSDIYVIGGYSTTSADPTRPYYLDDIWKSTDEGLTWTEVATTTKFPARSNHSSVVIGSDIYVIAGYSTTSAYLDDVWKSTDEGLTWTQVTTTGTKFPARRDHSSVVIGSDIYVMGGFDGTNHSSVRYTNHNPVIFDDVWKSTDKGLTWTQVTTAKFSAHSSHSSVVRGSAVYVIGGFSNSGRLNNVWVSR